MIGTSPCAAMRGMRRGKQKGAGALPEMASGTLPLLRRFGSKYDELITREQHVQEGERTNKILLLLFDGQFLATIFKFKHKFVFSV